MRNFFVPQPAPAQLKCLVRQLNARFSLEGFGKGEILELLGLSDSERASLSAQEQCLLQLCRGCALVGIRIQEFAGSLVAGDIGDFFASKAKEYAALAGGSPEPMDETGIGEMVGECARLRRSIPAQFVCIVEFDGRGALARERWVDVEQLECAHEPLQKRLVGCPRIYLHPLSAVEYRVEGVEALLKYVCSALVENCVDGDVSIATAPTILSIARPDAREFVTAIAQSGAGFLSHYKIGILNAVLRDLKESERLQVQEVDYIKPYARYSIYRNADHEHEVHQYLRMNSAVRAVVEFKVPGGEVKGLADVRVIRPSGSRSLDLLDTAPVVAAGLFLGNALERAALEVPS